MHARILVLVQVGFNAERLIANIALKFLLLVGLHVSSKVGSVCKLLSALSTSEGFLSRVRSHVSLQQPGSGESFVADITFMREVVG